MVTNANGRRRGGCVGKIGKVVQRRRLIWIWCSDLTDRKRMILITVQILLFLAKPSAGGKSAKGIKISVQGTALRYCSGKCSKGRKGKRKRGTRDKNSKYE